MPFLRDSAKPRHALLIVFARSARQENFCSDLGWLTKLQYWYKMAKLVCLQLRLNKSSHPTLLSISNSVWFIVSPLSLFKFSQRCTRWLHLPSTSPPPPVSRKFPFATLESKGERGEGEQRALWYVKVQCPLLVVLLSAYFPLLSKHLICFCQAREICTDVYHHFYSYIVLMPQNSLISLNVILNVKLGS